MTKPILPIKLRAKISDLFQQGFSAIEIFDLVIDEANNYIDSQELLSRCIISITGKHTSENGSIKNKKVKPPIPRIKHFDNKKYIHIINGLSEIMQEKEFEKSCHIIVGDILTNYEGFKDIEDVNKAPGFVNPPFDFFGFKNNEPYVIEFKGSLNNFNSSGETQKRRLKDLLNRIEGLNIALLQVKLRKAEYRILYNDEIIHLFEGYKMPIEPIEEWVRSRMKSKGKITKEVNRDEIAK